VTRELTITYTPETGFYHIDNKRIDTNTETVAYYARQLCGIPHLKRPPHEKVRQACRDAKSSGKPVKIIVA